MRYTTDQLLEIDTIRSGHDADLKIDDGQIRVWLSRNSIKDGEPFDNTIYVERNSDGRWVLSECYDGDRKNSV